jgi:hypothetical protein
MEILGNLLGILIFGGIWVWLKSNQTQAEMEASARRNYFPMSDAEYIKMKGWDTLESRKKYLTPQPTDNIKFDPVSKLPIYASKEKLK